MLPYIAWIDLDDFVYHYICPNQKDEALLASADENNENEADKISKTMNVFAKSVRGEFLEKYKRFEGNHFQNQFL